MYFVSVRKKTRKGTAYTKIKRKCMPCRTESGHKKWPLIYFYSKRQLSLKRLKCYVKYTFNW